MSDGPIFFTRDPAVRTLTDAELMTEWFALPENDDPQSRYRAIVVEMERRAVDAHD